MTKVLFSHSYYYRYDAKQWASQEPYPPLATIGAAAFIRQNGYDVKLFDTNLIESPSEIADTINSFKPNYFVLYDDGFNYLTKMCLTNMREAAFKMIELAKSNACKVIVSSSDSTDHFEKYLNAGADFILIGEAEHSLLELLTELESNRNVHIVAGIAFLNNGLPYKTPPRSVFKDLDELPLPAWDLVDILSYRAIWMKKRGYFSLNIATTRGCPYKCNWCAKPIYGNRYNSRSPRHVVDEIELLVKNYRADYFWMCDDIFGLKPGWVQEFNLELKKRELKIRYKIQSRVDLVLKEDSIDALVASGLDEVWVGAESGSQKILDAMDKGTQVEQIYEATQLLKSKGVKVAFFIQFGYLSENMDDIKKTIGMVLDLMPDNIGASVSYPLPGTKFYEIVKSQLNTKANWTDSDDLDLMFKNTYKPFFYKKLHRYLHKVYKRKKGLISINKIIKSPFAESYDVWRSALLTFYYIPGEIIDKIRLNQLSKR